MSPNERRDPEETRQRIMEAAWDLFRQLGTRTTVAEVAEKLGMSAANVYRFFPSKQALSEAVCSHVLGQMTAFARGVAAGSAPAALRIRNILLAMHRVMRDQMVGASRVHEIVEVAIQGRWAPIETFENDIAHVLAGLVSEGQAAGEFGPGDAQALGLVTLCACSGIHHPVLIALYDAPDADPTPEDIVDFALRALGNPKGDA